MPAPAPFGKLEQGLRNIWLECCGYMSAFRFSWKRICSKLPGNFAQVFPAPATPGFENEEQLLGEPIGRRLQRGGKLASEYDFGSKINLSLRVPEECPGSRPKARIRSLARNAPTDIRCASCREPATPICAEGEATGDDGAGSDACPAKPEYGKERLLPVVNMPRMGVGSHTEPSVEACVRPDQ